MWIFLLIRISLTLGACCLNCLQTDIDGCTQCSSGFLVENLCIAQCPTGYSLSGSICSLSTTLILETKFDNSVSLLENSFQEWHTTDYSSFATPSKASPLLTIDRGLWFVENSMMETYLSLMVSPISTLFLWVSPVSYGRILKNSVFTLEYTENGFEIAVYFRLQSSGLAETSLVIPATAGWNYLEIQIYQDSSTDAVINAEDLRITRTSAEANFPPGKWQMGGFSGFIYYIKFLSSIGSQIVEIEMPDCGPNEYFDTTCKSCSAECSQWPWCVRGTECSYCAVEDCTCYGYLESMIMSCGNDLTCTVDFPNVECLSACPTMYNLTEGICELVENTPAIVNFHFPNVQDFSDSEEKFHFYDTSGMLNAYKRGAYFGGISNFMVSSKSIQFSPVAIFTMWVYPMSSNGQLLTKLVDTSVIFSIGLQNDEFYIQVSSEIFTVPGVTSWTALSITIEVPNINAPSYSFYLNNILVGTSTGTIPIIDLSTSLVYLNYDFLFKGFLYEFIYWGTSSQDSSYISTYSCGKGPTSLLACPIKCDINYYDDSGCQQCPSDCLTCLTSYSCSTSTSPLCESNYSYDICSTCKEESNFVNSNCECNENYIYQLQNDICCHDSCETCNEEPYECGSCNTEVDGYCIHDCATLFEYKPESDTCVSVDQDLMIKWNFDITGTLIIDSSLNPYTVIKYELKPSSFNPFLTNEDPIPGKNRGLYFSGNTMVAEEFQMNKVHTWAIWFSPASSNTGNLLYKPLLGFAISYHSTYIQVFYSLESSNYFFSVTCQVSSQLNKWYFLVLRINYLKNTDISCEVFNHPSTLSTFSDVSIEDAMETLYINYVENSEFYTGWIYEMKYFAYYLNSIASQLNNKSGPISATGSLGTCGPSQYLSSDGLCKNCLEGCITCIDDQSCLVCSNKFCYSCYDFYTDTSCKKCDLGKVLYQDTLQCGDCYEGCAECWNTRANTCSYCTNEYTMSLEGLCLLHCATGDLEFKNICYAGKNNNIFKLTFNSILNLVYDKQNNLPVYMGNTNIFYPEYDLYDPVITQGRGLYFMGNSFATIGKSAELPTEVFFGNTHSFDLWAKPLAQSSDGTILSLSKSDTAMLTLSIPSFTDTFKVQVIYQLTSTTILKTIENPIIESSRTFKGWVRISWSFSLSSQLTIIKLYISQSLESTYTSTDFGFFEQLNNVFTFGRLLENNYYKGYLYSLVISKTLISFSNRFLTTCSCFFCTDDGACLSSCEIDEFEDSGQCFACMSECTNGCVRAENCLLHPDNLCDEYVVLDNDHCNSCVPNAVHNEVCQCIENSEFIELQRACVCLDNYQLIEGQCEICYRWVSKNEIKAVIGSDFMSIDLFFDLEVKDVNANCKNIFVDSNVFGKELICKMSKDSKVLTVVFDQDFTFVGGDIVVKNGAFIGKEVACGYFSTGDIRLTVNYPLPLPEVIAVINAPSTVIYSCHDLLVDGRLSTGLLNTVAVYVWRISSVPTNSALNKYNISRVKPFLLISHEDLTNSEVTIELTVKNIYNKTDTTSIQVSSTDNQNEIILYYDKSFGNSFLSSEDNDFRIKTIQCGELNDIDIFWEITEVQFNSTSLDTNYLISVQKNELRLQIPKKTIPGNTKTTFKLTVKEMGSERIGELILSLKALTSPPVMIIDQANGTFYMDSIVNISAGGSYTLDGFGFINFQWTCSALVDCTEHIINVTGESISFDDTLAVGNTYYFTVVGTLNYGLSLIKSASKTLVLDIVDYYVPKVDILAFQELELSSIQLPVAFTFTINGPYTDYSYFWEVLDPNVRLLTPFDSESLSIDPSSLTPGNTYSLQLSLIGLSGTMLYTKVFTINSPPHQGKFTCTPNYGYEYLTEFTLEGTNYIDDEENYPLTYSFGYIDGDSIFALNFRNLSNTFYTTLPYTGDYTSVILNVYDNLGDYITVKIVAQVYLNQNLNSTAIYIQMQNQLQLAEIDSGTTSVMILQLTDSIINREPKLTGTYSIATGKDLQLLQEAFTFAVEVFNSTQSLINSLDAQNFQCLLTSLNELTLNPNLQSNDNALSTLNMVNDMLDKYEDGIFPDEASEILDCITNVLVLSTDLFLTDTSLVYELGKTIATIGSKLLQYQSIGETVSVTSQGITIKTTVLASYQASNYSMSSADTSITLPGTFADLPEVQKSISLGLSLSTITPASNGITENFSLVEFSVFSDNEILKLELGDEKVFISIPVENIDQNSQILCVFLDVVNWNKTGCFLDSISDTVVVCKCNHLSLFSAGDAFNSAFDVLASSNIVTIIDIELFQLLSFSNATGLYIVLGICLVYVIIGRHIRKIDLRTRSRTFFFNRQMGKQAIEAISSATEKPEGEQCKNANIDSSNRMNVSLEYEEVPQYIPEISDGILTILPSKKTQSDPPISLFIMIRRAIIVKHELLRLLYRPLNEEPRFVSFTLVIIKLMIKMFLIGLFYDQSTIISSGSIGFGKSLEHYSWDDFWVSVYSIIISIFCLKLFIWMLRYSPIVVPLTDEVIKKNYRKNKIKNRIGFALVYVVFAFTAWSIILFSIKFDDLRRHLWMANILMGTFLDITAEAFLKTLIIETMKHCCIGICRK